MQIPPLLISGHDSKTTGRCKEEEEGLDKVVAPSHVEWRATAAYEEGLGPEMDWLFGEHLKNANSLCELSAHLPTVHRTGSRGAAAADGSLGVAHAASAGAKRRVTLSNVALDRRDRVGDAREGCSRDDLPAETETETPDGDDVAAELRRPDEFYSQLARFRFAHRRDCFSDSNGSLASSSSASSSAAALVSALMLESSANLRRSHLQRARDLAGRSSASNQLRTKFNLSDFSV